jgi:multiple sugar transport system substrate-binding protein
VADVADSVGIMKDFPVVRAAGVGRRDVLRLSAGGLLAAGLSAVSGCGSEPAATPGTGGASPTVTIRWWDYLLEPVRQAGVRAMIAKIESSVPGLRIERRVLPFNELAAALKAGVTSGDLPDIAIVDNPTVGPLAAKGVLADLSDRVQSWGQGDKYYPGPWQSCQFDGKVVSIPNNDNCLGLYCNTELLDAAKVKPPKNWAELSDAAHKLTAGRVRGLAMSAIEGEEGVFQFLPFLWQTGGDLETFATDGTTALTYLDTMVKAGALAKGATAWTQQGANTQFLSGSAAMQVNGPWQLPTLTSQTAVKWSIVPLPVGKEAATALGGENWVVFDHGDRVDMAWRTIVRSQETDVLIPFLTAMGVLPARTDLRDQGPWAKDAALQIFLGEMPKARPRAFGGSTTPSPPRSRKRSRRSSPAPSRRRPPRRRPPR